ncbi:ribosome maturation factor RimM [Orrella marina]|uniref:Ribosome maturation factor RimM n=1 Tax=Orrella marina TaxID=2163011 RepID=A0A2R4XI81_9BURK|nr:ribosome maturation factor RimM [Orrella marina]AWB33510.1 16S rRNA processing protein RimM [Orrella marina]
MTDSRAQSKSPQSHEAQYDPPADLVEVARVAGAHGVRGWVKLQPFSADSTVLDSVRTWWVSAPQKALEQALRVSADRDAHRSGEMPLGPVVPHRVVWSKVHGSTWLACLKGLVDRDQAHALKGSSVWVSRKDFPEPDAGEYYWVDLVGCEVYSTDAGNQPADSGDQPGRSSISLEQDASIGSDSVDSSEPPVTLPSDQPSLRIGVVDQIEDNPAHPLLSVLRQKPGAGGQWVPDLNARGKPIHTLIPFVAAHVLSVDLERKRIMVDWPADF